MTLGNMRDLGVRSLAVTCELCHHRAVLPADGWGDAVLVRAFGPRMVCTRCGIVGADERPDAGQQNATESTGEFPQLLWLNMSGWDNQPVPERQCPNRDRGESRDSSPHLTMTPLRFANPSPPSGWIEDFHLQAVVHTRHTTKRGGPAAAPL